LPVGDIKVGISAPHSKNQLTTNEKQAHLLFVCGFTAVLTS